MLDKDAYHRIHFHFQHKGLVLRNRRKLKAFIDIAFKKEKYKLQSLQFIFCSDEALLAINKEFLGHDYYTDVVSFNLVESGPIEGEVYISLDRVRENAEKLNQHLYIELHRVIFHAVLHLCGYRDKTQQEVSQMRHKESHYLAEYFK